MEYVGFLLRRERLRRSWSQEGLCKGICTVSYLSKIEQVKAAASDALLRLLMERMDLCWVSADPKMDRWLEQTYEALFGYEDELAGRMDQVDMQTYLYSPYGPDLLLLNAFANDLQQPLEEALEPCLNTRQLAMQRLLQGRYGEAVRLCPSAFFYSAAGGHYYDAGQVTAALEALQMAYQLAAQEGRPRIMLFCRMTMGNCYSNQRDLAAMEEHYAVARRLAKALGDRDSLMTIDYNTAATQLEAGQYEKALAYFESLENPRRLDLHKLAICYEKLGRPRQALSALDRAKSAEPSPWMPAGLEAQILDLVRLRLVDPGYLKSEAYGTLLLEVFHRCRRELPSGYAGFHLNWVLEWLEANRQYKQALHLLRDFPVSIENNGLNGKNE